MKKTKSSITRLLILLVISTLVSSCMTTKTCVGEFKETQAMQYTYAKGKQFYAFWGLIPIGRTNVNTPGDGNCEVITRFNFGDILINSLTLGVINSYSIKVKAKRKETAITQ